MAVGKVMIPTWARSWIQIDGVRRLEAKVTEAESQGDCEYLLMVARQSSTTGHVAGMLFLIWLFVAEFIRSHLLPNLTMHLAVVVILQVMISLLLTWMMASWSWLQRRLTSSEDQDYQARMRAECEVHRHGMQSTSHRRALLILISLMEHEVVIWPDAKIEQRFGTIDWQPLISRMASLLKKKRLEEALKEAVDFAQKHLSQPLTHPQESELSDHLRFLD